jgi:hypothetical protein
MKKDFIFCFSLSLIMMFILPLLLIAFVKHSDAGMAICFLLFFVINPLYALFVGAFAGNHIKVLWSQPILSSLLFFLGVRLALEMDIGTCTLFASVYLALGLLAMGLSWLIRKIKNH